MATVEPDRRATFRGRYHVDLWQGLLRSRVNVWKDVSPALGGLLGYRTVWRWKGIAEWEKVVAEVETISAEEGE